MDKKFVFNELKVLQNKTFKALNVFEEEHDIKPLNVHVKYPLTYSRYIDFIVKEIEGLVRGLNANEEEDRIIVDGLNEIKHSLLSIHSIGDKTYYKILRQRIFKNLNRFDLLIEQVER